MTSRTKMVCKTRNRWSPLEGDLFKKGMLNCVYGWEKSCLAASSCSYRRYIFISCFHRYYNILFCIRNGGRFVYPTLYACMSEYLCRMDECYRLFIIFVVLVPSLFIHFLLFKKYECGSTILRWEKIYAIFHQNMFTS